MRLFLYFHCEDWRTPSHPRYILYGRYSKVGLGFACKSLVTVYYTQQGGCYSRMDDALSFIKGSNGKVDLLLLPHVDQETAERVFRTCEACATAKIPFNLQDILLMYAPIVVPTDVPLFRCQTLNNTQAVILILRECLPVDHALYVVLACMNSRQTLAEEFFNALAPYATHIVNTRQIHEKILDSA